MAVKLTLAEARIRQDTDNPPIEWRPNANRYIDGHRVKFENLEVSDHFAELVVRPEYAEEDNGTI